MLRLTYVRHIVILILSTLLLILYTATISNDFIQYQLIFNKIKASDGALEAVLENRYEPGFTILYYLLSDFVKANNAFLIVAFTILLIKYILFIRYLDYPITSWLVYIVIFLPYLEANQLRTAIASAVILYVLLTPDLKQKYILQAMLASIFHYIGLIILILKYNNKPIVSLLLILFLAGSLNSIIPLVSNSIFKFNYFLTTGTESVNLINSNTIAQFFISIYCVYNWKSFNNVQKRGAFFIIAGLLIYIILSDNPGIVHRVREVSLLGIFPLLFSGRIRVTPSSLLAFSGVLIIFTYYLYSTTSESLSFL
jgi:hypothetical protein